MSDKTTRWAFTAYEGQWHLFKKMHPLVRQWGWNHEKCPNTERLHYQGYMITRGQHRFKGPPGAKSIPADSLRKFFPGVHIEAAIPDKWQALLNYCKKSDTQVPGTVPVNEYNNAPDMYSYSEDLATRLPNWASVRELWMSDCNEKLRYCRRRQAEPCVLGLTIYKSPEEYAYDVILKKIISNDIQAGNPVEYITQNPLFITMWKNKIRDLIFRRDYPYQPPPSMLDRQTDNVLISFD